MCDLEVTQDKWYNYFHQWSKLPGKKVLNKFKSRRCSQITMLVHSPHHITVNFQETAYLSIVLSLFIHKISSKHDRDYNIQAEFKLKCFSHSLHASLFAKMSGWLQVLDTCRYAANEFYSKIWFTVYSRLLI